MSDPSTIDVSSRAVITDDVELLRGQFKCYSEGMLIHRFFSHDGVRVQGAATDSDRLFMGVAPVDAVAGYLDGITHETPRWTLWGRSVLPTTVEGRVAVLFAVLFPVPFIGAAMFGAPIFLLLGGRKGDRGLLLVLPVLVSIIVLMFIAIVVWGVLF